MSADPHGRSVTDERIERAVTASGVVAEFCEWYGNPEHRIAFRIEPHMGRYIEVDLWPWMDDDDLADKIKRASERLDGRDVA